MTKEYCSPILRSRLDNNQKDHNKIYRDLKRRANTVKPNEPKAKLIRQTPVQKITDPIIDTFGDGRNFFKAVKTGKLNDNNLGRINDLGMKAGALLIASFLASKAKTKTDAIMQYVGGATFFASMALWPKIFINLPAKLVHGFRIDHKYLSAQGDKKDLGLDNQFQPMDIFTDEEMLKMAKNAGIDPKDKHAKEKIQRKMQKTMLQNRTLWMATAGFATPLLTSLTGNFVEPKITNKVIKNAFENTKEALSSPESLADYMSKAKNIVSNKKEVEEALDALNKAFKETPKNTEQAYNRLVNLLEVNDILGKFKDPNDAKPLTDFKSSNVKNVLEAIRKDLSTVSEDNLRTVLSNTEKLYQDDLAGLISSQEDAFGVAKSAAKNVKDAAANLVETGAKTLEKSDIDALIGQLNGDYSLKNIEKVLLNASGNLISEDSAKKALFSLGSKADNKNFINAIKEYNENTLGALRGRLKAYLELVNSVVGDKRESVYTKEYLDTVKELFDTLEIQDSELKQIAKGKDADVSEFLVKKMQAKVHKDDDRYIDLFIPKHATGKLSPEAEKIRLEAMPDGIKKSLLGFKIKAGEFIEKHLKPAGDKVKAASGQTATQQDKINSLTEILSGHLKDINTAKSRLKALFGENFEELFKEGDNDISNFFAYIDKGNGGWINNIIDNYSRQAAAPVDKKQIEASFTSIIEAVENSRDAAVAKMKTVLKIEANDIIPKLKFDIYPGGLNSVRNLVNDGTVADFAFSTRKQEVESIVDMLQNRETMQSITGIEDELKPLTEAIFGGNAQESAYDKLANFINLQRTNLSAVKAKAIIFANFERRVKDGLFDDLNESQLLATRKMIIDGNINEWKNAFSMYNKREFEKLAERLFDPQAFAKEEQHCYGIKAIIEELKNMKGAVNEGEGINNALKYRKTGSLLKSIKNTAGELYRNKSWKKIFVPMTLALIAVTLLAQPFFGKIKKEFPEDNGNGGRN